MKFQMMLGENEKYRDDFVVIDMLGKVRELDNTQCPLRKIQTK
jgi:hypothetical protein